MERLNAGAYNVREIRKEIRREAIADKVCLYFLLFFVGYISVHFVSWWVAGFPMR